MSGTQVPSTYDGTKTVAKGVGALGDVAVSTGAVLGLLALLRGVITLPWDASTDLTVSVILTPFATAGLSALRNLVKHKYGYDIYGVINRVLTYLAGKHASK